MFSLLALSHYSGTEATLFHINCVIFFFIISHRKSLENYLGFLLLVDFIDGRCAMKAPLYTSTCFRLSANFLPS